MNESLSTINVKRTDNFKHNRYAKIDCFSVILPRLSFAVVFQFMNHYKQIENSDM